LNQIVSNDLFSRSINLFSLSGSPHLISIDYTDNA